MEVNPKNAFLHAVRARYLAKLGWRKESLAALAQFEMAPDDVSATFEAGLAYYLNGRPEKALELLRLAVGQGYSRDEIRMNPEFQAWYDQPDFQQLITP